MFVGLLQAGVLRRRVFTVGVPSINSQTQGNSDVCSIYIYVFFVRETPNQLFFWPLSFPARVSCGGCPRLMRKAVTMKRTIPQQSCK